MLSSTSWTGSGEVSLILPYLHADPIFRHFCCHILPFLWVSVHPVPLHPSPLASPSYSLTLWGFPWILRLLSILACHLTPTRFGNMFQALGQGLWNLNMRASCKGRDSGMRNKGPLTLRGGGNAGQGVKEIPAASLVFIFYSHLSIIILTAVLCNFFSAFFRGYKCILNFSQSIY